MQIIESIINMFFNFICLVLTEGCTHLMISTTNWLRLHENTNEESSSGLVSCTVRNCAVLLLDIWGGSAKVSPAAHQPSTQPSTHIQNRGNE